MAAAIAFDTYAYVKSLRDVGVPEEVAEVQANALMALIEDRLATKQELFGVEAALKRDNKELEASLKRDMKELEASLKRDVKELETSVKRDIKELEMRLLIRLGALLVIAVGAVATLVKIL